MIKLSSRRYIGNKAKLANWIMDNLKSHFHGGAFCDLFAGTGVIAEAAIPFYDRIIINDLLLSNNIIHRAFFEEVDIDNNKIYSFINVYNNIDPKSIAENYFSRHFGGKYFDNDSAKIIGYIRDDIERHDTLTPKEYCVLLTSLIYGMDRIANTVGHFDAYIKKPIKQNKLSLSFPAIHPHINASVLREDANDLAGKIVADIIYIDPPYNSRQYSRFYHIYENLVKWSKPPLYGIALKPKPENMSAYCTNKARYKFAHLIDKLQAPVLAVSYNNTYASKSTSSRNKINLDDIKDILCKRGFLTIYEMPYAPFNTGKTNFADHKEYL